VKSVDVLPLLAATPRCEICGCTSFGCGHAALCNSGSGISELSKRELASYLAPFCENCQTSVRTKRRTPTSWSSSQRCRLRCESALLGLFRGRCKSRPTLLVPKLRLGTHLRAPSYLPQVAGVLRVEGVSAGGKREHFCNQLYLGGKLALRQWRQARATLW
jgi:predicted nucleic-acid-binding Zn-ribbon protein